MEEMLFVVRAVEQWKRTGTGETLLKIKWFESSSEGLRYKLGVAERICVRSRIRLRITETMRYKIIIFGYNLNKCMRSEPAHYTKYHVHFYSNIISYRKRKAVFFRLDSVFLFSFFGVDSLTHNNNNNDNYYICDRMTWFQKHMAMWDKIR